MNYASITVQLEKEKTLIPLYILPILVGFFAYVIKTAKDLSIEEALNEDFNQQSDRDDDAENALNDAQISSNESEFDVEFSQIDDNYETDKLKTETYGSKKELERFFAGLVDYYAVVQERKPAALTVKQPIKKKVVAPFRQTSRGPRRRRINSGI